MEILTLFRLNGRRVVTLAVVGALTGSVAAAAVSRQSASFRATTTVFVSQALPEGSSAFDVGPVVADFEKAVTLPQVRESTAERLSLPLDDVAATTLRTSNDGGAVEVTAEAGSAADAEAISQTMSTEAMRFLAQREVDRTTRFEKERQEATDKAQAAVDKILSGNGFADPSVTYEQTMTRVLQLTLDKSDPTKTFTNEQRLAADAETTRLRLQLPALKQLADDFDDAKQTAADARQSLQSAQQARTAAEEVLAAATTDLAISPGETVQQPRLPIMVQAFVAAMVATFAVGIAFFMTADRSRRRGQVPQAVTPGTAAVPARTPTDNGASATKAKPGTTAASAAGSQARTTGTNGASAAAKSSSKSSTTAAAAAAGKPASIDTVDATPTAVRGTGSLTDAESVFARPKSAGTAAATHTAGDDTATTAGPKEADLAARKPRKSADSRRRLGS